MIALVVDPESTISGGAAEALAQFGFQPVITTSAGEGLERFHAALPALVILDVDAIDVPGRQLLRHFRSHASHVPIVALVGEVDVPTAVEVVRTGATEVIGKSSNVGDFRLILQKVLPEALAAHHRQAPDRDRALFFERYECLFRRSEGMRAVEALVMRVAATESPVLVQGEAGTGKELVAKAIHYLSGRYGKPWQRVSCAPLPGDLLEADIFGQRTSTVGPARQSGKLELADGGTLLIDEIDRLPVMLQARIVQVMRDGEFFRPGGHELVGADVRILATTIRDLETVPANAFRQDLQRLIGAVTIVVPPLRERREEIRGLIDDFRTRFAVEFNRPEPSPSRSLLRHLADYDWPGNVRELENMVKRWVVLGNETNVMNELAAHGQARRPSTPAQREDFEAGLSLSEVERRHILRTLHKARGNRTEAARLLQISIRCLQYKLKAYGRDVESPLGSASSLVPRSRS